MAFECGHVRAFWEEAVVAMEVVLVDATAVERVIWGGFSFEQKCKWAWTASDGGFEAQTAARMHQCMAVG